MTDDLALVLGDEEVVTGPVAASLSSHSGHRARLDVEGGVALAGLAAVDLGDCGQVGGKCATDVHSTHCPRRRGWLDGGMSAAPDAIVPDTKDWTWVLERPCPECGFDPAAQGLGDLPRLVHDTAMTWSEVLGAR